MIAFRVDSPNPEDVLARDVRMLFPATVSIAYADSSEVPPTAYPEEVSAISRAVPARQREFAQGRWCARAALRALGVAPAVLPVGSLRGPVWPEGVVGSITHCAGFVGAAVARSADVTGIGFDAEPAKPLGEELVPLVCRPEEIEFLGRMRPAPHADWYKIFFSAKEAIHKCISPISGVMLDFRDVVLSVGDRDGVFTAELSPGTTRHHLPELARLVGRYVATRDFIFTSARIETDRSTRAERA